ncbi:hypothetical protein [Dyella sp. 2RAB6]|uniref:hypothetical protein n=1 Tax=Dyella sp. 2RAB6 TaxID=3232992 RepID=UPI003F92B6F5
MANDRNNESIRLIIKATLVAGCLDLASAFVYAVIDGHPPLAVLFSIAAGVWPGARNAGLAGMLAGLVLHFAIMSAMVSVYVLLVRRWSWTGRHPFIAGSLYGLGLWCVMYLLVLPLRWPSILQHMTLVNLGEQWLSHVALVGIPIAVLAARFHQPLPAKVAAAMDH